MRDGMNARLFLGALSLLLLVGGCSHSPSMRTTISLVNLADTVEPMRARFNRDRDRPRFVAILSPT